MNKLFVIKIGGNVIDNEEELFSFLEQFAAIKDKKILVHGGGKLASSMADKLGIEQSMVEGRRITNAETLQVVTMVYAGSINKTIVAKLQAHHCNALGLCGADGNIIQAHKRNKPGIDYGFAGDIDKVNVPFLEMILEKNFTPVICPITHDGSGQLLNTNADTIASHIAAALSAEFEVSLVYLFEKPGVLENTGNNSTVISKIDKAGYADLKNKQVITAGMLPKLENAFDSLQKGVEKVIIGNSNQLAALMAGQSGTQIVND